MYAQHYQQQPAQSARGVSPPTSASPQDSLASSVIPAQPSQMMSHSIYQQQPQYHQVPPQYYQHMAAAQNMNFDPSAMGYPPLDKSMVPQYPIHLQQPPLGHPHSQLSSQNNTVYSFVVPTQQQQKRPRRRYEEIERIYQCNWESCNKAYGTLNHLNAHVTMQKHGPKRTPEEFKEIRRLYKQKKKDEDEARKKATAEAQQALGQGMPMAHHPGAAAAHPGAPHVLWNNTPQNVQMAPPPQPAASGNVMDRAYSSNMYIKDENYMEYFNSGNMSPAQQQNPPNAPQTPSSSASSSSAANMMGLNMPKSASMDMNSLSYQMMGGSGNASGSTSQTSPSAQPYAMNYNNMISQGQSMPPNPQSQQYPYMYEEKR